MQIKALNGGALSVSVAGGKPMIITPHAIERWMERISGDTESMCYRASVARRIPSRELRKFKRKNFALRNINDDHELREHGGVIFIIDPKRNVVITVIKSEYVK